jgi:hypothetical protein
MMLTTTWHHLDPEIAARGLDLVDSDDPGAPLPAAIRAEILGRLRDRLRRGEVVAIARLSDGEEEVFLGSPAEAAARMRQGMH